jgi:sugar diacid utilization regulator
MTITAGNMVEAESLKTSYENAKRTMFWVQNRGKANVGFFEDLGVLSVLDPLIAEKIVRTLQEKYISPLLECDKEKNMELFTTMEQYIISLWNYTDASKKLFIHSNTVKYRIKQSESILGIDLSDYQERLNMEMAISIHSYMEGKR